MDFLSRGGSRTKDFFYPPGRQYLYSPFGPFLRNTLDSEDARRAGRANGLNRSQQGNLRIRVGWN
ncbi:MAG TPA: hypothetical protein VFA18_06450, partial [Gemmataceae bacterium]|nr:hypothetical protein [Gemmataceae bacterium]